MNTTCPLADTRTSDIVLIATTIITGLLSLADLAINAYVGVKKRHLTSSCCSGVCSCVYDSESQDENDLKNKNLKEVPEKSPV